MQFSNQVKTYQLIYAKTLNKNYFNFHKNIKTTLDIYFFG